ncbi:hypothetical protein [Erythrobacter alti]|uniref:hypothetical protein n=1 Tax=Erythrobacter alti TaxID=1896145 RepID=UPI0030F446FA
MKNLLTITMIGGTALASIMSSPALAIATETPSAQGPNGATLSAMQSQCNSLALAHGPAWSGELDLGSINGSLISGPTQVGGRTIVGEIEGYGDLIPSDPYIAGDPYRTGGSVNMFGDQRASAAWYPHSRYDYTANFTSMFSYAFSCNMSERVRYPATGHHEWRGPSQADPQAAACRQWDLNGIHQGVTLGPCEWVEDDPAHDEDEPRNPEAGVPISETQTDNLMGHEEDGGRFEISGDLFIGKVVVCISPSTSTRRGVPGEWRQQNGYTGNKCTTTWFNVAPWGGGSQTSNGTYISVPPAT